jgi:hypothetical protein
MVGWDGTRQHGINADSGPRWNPPTGRPTAGSHKSISRSDMLNLQHFQHLMQFVTLARVILDSYREIVRFFRRRANRHARLASQRL